MGMASPNTVLTSAMTLMPSPGTPHPLAEQQVKYDMDR
jgi:hypothetical protein